MDSKKVYQRRLTPKLYVGMFVAVSFLIGIFLYRNFHKPLEIKSIQGMVTQVTLLDVIFKDKKDFFYTIPNEKENFIKVGDEMVVFYSGEIQEVSPAIIKNVVKIERK